MLSYTRSKTTFPIANWRLQILECAGLDGALDQVSTEIGCSKGPFKAASRFACRRTPKSEIANSKLLC